MTNDNPRCTCRGSALGPCHVEPRDLTLRQIRDLVDETVGGVYQGVLPESGPNDREWNRWHKIWRRDEPDR